LFWRQSGAGGNQIPAEAEKFPHGIPEVCHRGVVFCLERPLHPDETPCVVSPCSQPSDGIPILLRSVRRPEACVRHVRQNVVVG
jgi:hypothetical protein